MVQFFFIYSESLGKLKSNQCLLFSISDTENVQKLGLRKKIQNFQNYYLTVFIFYHSTVDQKWSYAPES